MQTKKIRAGMIINFLHKNYSLAVPIQELINALIKISNEDFKIVCLSLKRASKLSHTNKHMLSMIHIPSLSLGVREGLSEISNITHECLLGTIHALSPIVVKDLYYSSKEDSDSDHARLERDLQYLEGLNEKFNKIITVSENMRQQIIDYLGVRRDKIEVIHHGVDHSLFHPANNRRKTFYYLQRKYGLKNKPYILHVGHGYPLKNVPRILKAYQESKKKGLKHQLVLVGHQPPNICEMAEEIKDVLLTGSLPHKELADLYACADILLQPSLYESFSISILEAMASGIPVVTSDRFAMPEIAGEAALYVDPFDIDSMSSAIVRILTDIDLKNSLAEKAFERSQSFSWERCAREHLSLYRSITSEKRDTEGLSEEQLAILNLISIYDSRPDLQKMFHNGNRKLSVLIKWAVRASSEGDTDALLLRPYNKWYRENREFIGSLEGI